MSCQVLLWLSYYFYSLRMIELLFICTSTVQVIQLKLKALLNILLLITVVMLGKNYPWENQDNKESRHILCSKPWC